MSLRSFKKCSSAIFYMGCLSCVHLTRTNKNVNNPFTNTFVSLSKLVFCLLFCLVFGLLCCIIFKSVQYLNSLGHKLRLVQKARHYVPVTQIAITQYLKFIIIFFYGIVTTVLKFDFLILFILVKMLTFIDF